MNTPEIIDALLSISESMNEDDRAVLERASEILLDRQSKTGTYGPFESRVTAIGNTHYVSVGAAVKALGLVPRDHVKVTIEKL